VPTPSSSNQKFGIAQAHVVIRKTSELSHEQNNNELKTHGEHTLSNRLATLRPTRQLDCREAARHPIAASISRKQAGTSVPHFPIMLLVKQECLGKSRCECQGATPNHIGCVRKDSISADPRIRKIRDQKSNAPEFQAEVTHKYVI
jgi:hypothetical protein